VCLFSQETKSRKGLTNWDESDGARGWGSSEGYRAGSETSSGQGGGNGTLVGWSFHGKPEEGGLECSMLTEDREQQCVHIGCEKASTSLLQCGRECWVLDWPRPGQKRNPDLYWLSNLQLMPIPA
jgi:hypothetical protein